MRAQSTVDDRPREKFATKSGLAFSFGFFSSLLLHLLTSGLVLAGRARAAETREISRQRG